MGLKYHYILFQLKDKAKKEYVILLTPYES